MWRSRFLQLRLFPICLGGVAAIRRGREKTLKTRRCRRGDDLRYVLLLAQSTITGIELETNADGSQSAFLSVFLRFLRASRRTSTCDARTGWRNSGLNPWRLNAPGASAGRN